MTAQDYRTAGYKVSTLIDQTEIDRAEKDVLQAYVYPIMQSADPSSDEVVRDCMMALAFLLVMQRSYFATRSGGKEKLTPQSYSAEGWNMLSQNAETCAMKIEAVRRLSGASKKARVHDICGIYFETQYFS